MRLVLVHGINNERNSRESIEATWCGALTTAWERLQLPSNARFSVATVYYADVLADLSQPSDRAVMAGGGSEQNTETELCHEFMDELKITDEDLNAAALQEGITDFNIAQAGIPHETWCIVVARAIENASPAHGIHFARLFLRQASVYIERAGVQRRVKALVESVLLNGDGPDVVVAHSLGTLLSYEILAENPSRRVPLFVTLGSPLPVRIVRDYVGKRHSFPKPPIERWINGYNRTDFITLGRELSRSILGFDGVENTMVTSTDPDSHSISVYLSNDHIASSIHAALAD